MASCGPPPSVALIQTNSGAGVDESYPDGMAISKDFSSRL